MKRLWRPICKFEDSYLVSNFGEVKSLSRSVMFYRGKWLVRNIEGVILKVRLGNRGYQLVILYKNGRKFTKRVHCVVARAFLGVRPYGLSINHKDGDKSNNFANNLEYITYSDNIRHAYALGLRSSVGENNPIAKLTYNKVREIRMNNGRISQVTMARDFNVSNATISMVINRKIWCNI